MLAIPELEDLFFYRALNSELSSIKSIESNKKTLFVMIDDSGSMDNPIKKGLVSLIMNIIKKRLSKNVNAYIFNFESDLYQDVTHLNTTSHKNGFSGGGTNVEKSLKTLFVKMNDYKLDKASILIINDGEDNVTNFVTPCKVSALILKTTNKGLTDLCTKSNGIAYTL